MSNYFLDSCESLANRNERQKRGIRDAGGKIFTENPVDDLWRELLQYSYRANVEKFLKERSLPKNENVINCIMGSFFQSFDIQNSLSKFFELQDFVAKFYVVADEYRREKYKEIINRSIYSAIRGRVNFVNYDSVSKQYEAAFREKELTVI